MAPLTRSSLSLKDLALQSSPAAAPRKRILAIDYGRRRIGLALSDELQVTASPLATLERANRRDDLRRLREICREHSVAKIIVGNPLHLDGAASEMSAEAARFAARVKKELRLPVELVDERLSSWEAGQTLAEAKSRLRGRGRMDEVAAAVILRDYLDRERARKPAKG